MTFRYSVRFSRWNGSVRPGLGRAAAAVELGLDPADEASCVASSGRGLPAGGISPVRTFRTICSHVSASRATA